MKNRWKSTWKQLTNEEANKTEEQKIDFKFKERNKLVERTRANQMNERFYCSFVCVIIVRLRLGTLNVILGLRKEKQKTEGAHIIINIIGPFIIYDHYYYYWTLNSNNLHKTAIFHKFLCLFYHILIMKWNS